MQLERTSDAVTEAVIATRAGEPAPDLAQVAVLRRAIRQLEEDVRDAPRGDDDAEIYAEGVLAPGGPRGGRRPPAGPRDRPRTRPLSA